MNTSKRPSKSVACPQGEADNAGRDKRQEDRDPNENSFWVVLRDASKLQCSVASNCALTDGKTASLGRSR